MGVEQEASVASEMPTRSKVQPISADGVVAIHPVRRRAPGRARSDASRIAILNAALRLLETQNLQQITIESIAREAEVGKATIYRWWPSKASIVIEAFVQNHIVHTPMRTDVSVLEALRQHMHSLIEQYAGWSGRVVAQILAEGQSNPQVLREFRERFFHGRRAMVREVLELGVRRGEIRADMDADLLMDFMYATIYFRLILQHLPLDQHHAEELSKTMLSVIATPPAEHAPATIRRTAKGRQRAAV